MEKLFYQQVEAGDIVFISESHVPNDVFAPALSGDCYVCISAYADQVAVRTRGLINGTVSSSKDFIPMHAIERVVSMNPTIEQQVAMA